MLSNSLALAAAALCCLAVWLGADGLPREGVSIYGTTVMPGFARENGIGEAFFRDRGKLGVF